MDNKKPNFEMIICDIDSDTVNFIAVGKQSLLTRLKYNCHKFSKENYAFQPRNEEEFLNFLIYTHLTKTFSDDVSFDFKITAVSPSTNQYYNVNFEHLLGYFLRQIDSTKEDFGFVNEARKIRDIKIKVQSRLSASAEEKE